MKHEYKLKIICDQQHFQNNMQTKHEFILLYVLPYDFEKKFHIQKIMCGSVHVHIYQG